MASGLPGGSAIAAVLLVAAGLAIGFWLYRRPPRDAPAAAWVCAAGLLTATLLMPASRFGYLLYPAAYAVWAVALPRGGAERRVQPPPPRPWSGHPSGRLRRRRVTAPPAAPRAAQ